jgi:hypothetical protein
MLRLLAVTPEKNPWFMAPFRLKIPTLFNADASIVMNVFVPVVIEPAVSGEDT